MFFEMAVYALSHASLTSPGSQTMLSLTVQGFKSSRVTVMAVGSPVSASPAVYLPLLQSRLGGVRQFELRLRRPKTAKANRHGNSRANKSGVSRRASGTG